MFLRSASECPGSVRANSPVVSGGVSPLKNALRAFEVLRKLKLNGDHDAVAFWNVIPSLVEGRPNQKHVLVEAVHRRIFIDVVVRAKLELEKSSVIGSHFYLGFDFLAGFVRLDDDAVRVLSIRGFVLAGSGVVGVAADAALALCRTVLVGESSAVSGGVVVVRRVVEALSPHRRSGDRIDQPAMSGCLIHNCQADEGKQAHAK